MLDTSRHYYNIGTILQTLDAMSYLKLNVFHFHIIDDESFPLVVPKRPLLHENAAYDKDLTYTPDDLTKIVSYANERGIRVVFETDIPGHAMSWQKGYPNIAAKCPGFHANVLDITKDETYDVIGDVMNLIVSVSLDSFYHIGGDEISQDCYEHDPSVVQFMKQHNISDVNHLVGYFVARVADMLAKRNKTMVCWHDLTNHKDAFRLPKDTIVEAWWALKNIGIIIDRGYRVINSAGWYLDYLNVGVWDMYTVEPYDGGNFTDAQKKMILGGEAPLWSEYVDDTNFNARVYPRLLAVAERLWSPQNIKDVTTALPRIDHMGCQIMLKRGIPVPPVQPGYCNKMKYKKPW
jgi:hexosaminidase